MTVHHGIRHRSDETQPGDEVISTFLYLGERLRAHGARSSHSASEARGERTSRPNGQGGDPTLDQEGADALFRVIEGDIIPRLLLAHQQPEVPGHPGTEGRGTLTMADRSRFLELVLSDSASGARELVDDLLDRGVSRETIFLDLLTHTARRLGELWEQDLCDFAEVTIGLCRLHQVLREQTLSRDWDDPRLAEGAPRILLATACADQHVFGTVMVGEFFRRDGWRVWSEPGTACERVSGILGSERFDMLGVSAACSPSPDRIRSEIGRFRTASCNRQLRILVGGRLFAEAPALVQAVGADAMAPDAQSAPEVGRELLARSPDTC